ncbi:MAG TPA: hypothetical protein DDW49_10635 [Deltaproteobacteria bacterium]|nr:MAG: hypothetical protein A2048_02885 [Deltaproteobacteria bacterium GWA2_45_12]HBF13819.1 hypothetical protein [Deltaproteobacteria bacterium]
MTNTTFSAHPLNLFKNQKLNSVFEKNCHPFVHLFLFNSLSFIANNMISLIFKRAVFGRFIAW